MDKLKILIIPSWYPNKKDPLWGNYFIKQAIALSEYASVSMLHINRVGLKEINNLIKERKNDGYDKEKYPFDFYQKTIINYKAVSLNYSFKKYAKCAYKAYKKLENVIGRPDIILVESALPAGLAAKYIKEKEGIPYIVHEHSLDVMNSPYYKDYVKEIIKCSDGYMAVNNNIKDKIESISKINCKIVPNFIDCKKFDLKKNGNKDNFTLINISNFYKVKALDVLLKALNIVVNEKCYKDVFLNIVGTGDYKDYYESISRSLNLDDNVKFMGYINNDELPKILNNADVLCVSSTFETFCIPIVEAFSSGIPVITTNCTGPMEIVNKDNSIVVNIGDIESYADAIIKMKTNYNKYNKNLIKKYAYNKYDKSVVCKNIIEIAKNIINK